MVRFIIKMETKQYTKNKTIYIPIWLDLLYAKTLSTIFLFSNLHSNMVRFIIFAHSTYYHIYSSFTFQYGQIYYTLKHCLPFFFFLIYIPIWLDLLYLLIRHITIYIHHLHSNMVRFIIGSSNLQNSPSITFTFQYGQIYYSFVIFAELVKP